MLRYFITLFLALVVVAPVISKAQSPEEALRARLSALFPGLQRASIKASPTQISQYLQEGIEVRYMTFPRTGLNTPSYDKAVDVWCADNRRVALTRAKRGQPVPQRTCNNPVKQQMALGRRFGVSGTPAILLEDGEMLPGYRPAKALSAMLDTRG